jgi:hypothetical protein
VASPTETVTVEGSVVRVVGFGTASDGMRMAILEQGTASPPSLWAVTVRVTMLRRRSSTENGTFAGSTS